MSAAPENPAYSGSNRRRMSRYSIAIPVDITVLRSGVPDSIPGRTVNFGEGGVAAILAGELRTGDSVGVELWLEGSPEPLLAKAVVRHHQQLRCGLEFQGLSPDQQEIIHLWSRRGEPLRPLAPPRIVAQVQRAEVASLKPRPRFRPLLWAAAAGILLLAGIGGWQWHRSWEELESNLPDKQSSSEAAVPMVASSEVEQLVLHRVDPVYPEAAKRANLQGVVVLATVIGRDGSVEKVSPVSGPDVLASAAMDAVRWWRFQPYLVNGKAVEIETTLAVEFRL